MTPVAKNLRRSVRMVYALTVTEQSVIGVSVPILQRRPNANPRRFFVPTVYDGLFREGEIPPFLCTVTLIPLQSVAILLALNCGGHPPFTKEATMADSNRNIPAPSAHQSLLSEIQTQCRQTAFSMAFAISRLKEGGNPDVAKQLQDVSIALSRIAQELEGDHA
jgi:hypothetical protein